VQNGPGIRRDDAPDVFGRNEPGNQFFHKWVAYYLDETGQTPVPVMKG
jgi:transglutaminase-like putative cysteine protease